jgi:O-antigen ligase
MIARARAYFDGAAIPLNPRAFYNIVIVLGLCAHPVAAGASNLLGFDNTPVAVVLRAVIALAALISILCSLRVSQPRIARYYLVGIGLFWLLYALRLIEATFLSDVELRQADSFYWIWAVLACAVPMFGLAMRPTRREDLEGVFPWVLVLFAIAAFLAVFGAPNEDSRLALTNLNPISVGHLGVTVFILAAWTLIYRGPTTAARSAAIVLAGGVGYCLMVAANSRGPMVALVAVLIFMLVLSRRRQALAVALVLVAAVVAFAPVALLLDHAFGFTTFVRTFAPQEIMGGVTSGRDVLYKDALEGIMAHPLTGFAIELPAYRIYPHNIVLEAFMAVGVVGGALFLVTVTGLVIKGVVWFRRYPAQGWIVLLFLQAVIGAQFSVALFMSTAFWLCFGAMISLSMPPADRAPAGATAPSADAL